LKNLIESYLQSTREFSQMLEQRSPAEVAYDNEVLTGLRRGMAIRKALEAAAGKFPDEALQLDDASFGEINDHYQYLKNHEDILARLGAVSPKGAKRR
jgi:hypothetical protein